MTIKQFSKKTKIPLSTLYKKIKDGILTPCNIAGVWYIEVDREIKSKFECAFHPKKWIPVSEITREFGLSRQRLYYWKNKIQSKIENDKIYFHRKSIKQYLERRKDAGSLRFVRKSRDHQKIQTHTASRRENRGQML